MIFEKLFLVKHHDVQYKMYCKMGFFWLENARLPEVGGTRP